MVKSPVWSALLVCLVLGAVSSAASGAIVDLLPNPSFESGRTAPDHWAPVDPSAGGWEVGGRDGGRCVSITGYKDDVRWWAPTRGLQLEPNRLYYLAYWVRRDQQTRGGVAIAGLEWVNRDVRPEVTWGRRSFFFRTPEAAVSEALFRFGEWHVQGTVFFDDATLAPAIAVYGRPAGLELELGDGERITAGDYTAVHRLGGPGASDFRCLERFTARFNTNRWVFEGEREVVYRHAVGRLRQAAPEVEVGVNLYERGAVVIEASRDGESWVGVGEVTKAGRVGLPIPSSLAPARELWVRLRSTDGTALQTDWYQYRCRLLEGEPVELAVGTTHYLAVVRSVPGLEVEVLGVGPLVPRAEAEAVLRLRNQGARRSVRAEFILEKDDVVVSRSDRRVSLGPGTSRPVSLPYDLRGGGDHLLTIRCVDAESGERLWEVASEFSVPPLHDASGGAVLRDGRDLVVWWCEPERKVSRRRPPPAERGAAITIALAANEYEAVQLVIRPATDTAGCRLTATDLASASGAAIPASEIEIRAVEYVRVMQPTDEVGAVGDWPDPLPLHDHPMRLSAGKNHPFWITVHAPAGTPAGDYEGALEIEAGEASHRVPLQVHVWGFELPARTHVRSGFGLSSWLIRQYHNLDTWDEVHAVRSLYLEDFARHRVAPYSLGRGIGLEWETSPAGGLRPRLHFTEFDEDARRGLDELGFNSFRLDLAGLGGGSFHSRHLGEIEGLSRGTPEHEDAFTRYARAVETHLRDRGWLDAAYLYWFDEPAEEDYDFVREGMELIGRAAPGLTRMLTEQPEAALYGAVDLWCLPTYALEPDVVQRRQAAGEEVWWYLCTAPKAPHFTLFLDHHGTEIRLWLWQTWKYGLDGILVWQTVYWNSGNAYPEPMLQNPWRDAMSWTSGYGLGRGERRPWGNGDGRFLYPPNRDPANDHGKRLEGPVPSIRWELLRDGLEDYEYFWLLREHVERLKASGAAASLYEEEQALLEVPDDVCSDLTHFAITPEPIHRHRARLAAAIEKLAAY